jgi:nitroreductase
MALVRAAVLAANAHNAQPWHFKAAQDRVDLFADTSRSIGTMDSLGREMDVSLGCAIENLALAAPANGKAPTVSPLPDPADRTHILGCTWLPLSRLCLGSSLPSHTGTPTLGL